MIALALTALMVVVPGDRKCGSPTATMPGYENREPVVLIDGVIVERHAERLNLEPEQVAWIGIACWDPATDSFRADGIPVIRIHTNALVEATRAPLLELIEAQERFRARHERHAMDLPSLAAFGLDGNATLEFEVTASGWTAATPSGAVAYRCSANETSGQSIGDDGAPRLDCGPVDTRALRSLRAHFDAGASAR